jgi:hypothetical protein
MNVYFYSIKYYINSSKESGILNGAFELESKISSASELEFHFNKISSQVLMNLYENDIITADDKVIFVFLAFNSI